MPVFFQHQINDTTRLGIWKIEETEDFFKSNVPLHRDVTHPHKRLQHLAGRFLLQYLFPAFPYEMIAIADTRKPFLPDEQYHFSISHCDDYAAAIVSKDKRVGVDIEVPVSKIIRIRDKFLGQEELARYEHNERQLTLLWSSKEAVFKWYGNGAVDFREHIHLEKQLHDKEMIECVFTKEGKQELSIHYRLFSPITLAWIVQ